MPALRRKVLVVDHGTTLLPNIVEIITSLGYEVQVAANAVAIIVAEGYQPAVVVFDVGLPTPTTCELLGDFRRRLPHVPVVLIGVEVDARTIEHLLNKEAFSYIPRPFTRDTIATVLLRALAE